MTEPVLDASALLAYLNREPGADVVAEALAGGSRISTVNLAEILAIGADRGVSAERLVAGLTEVGLLGAMVLEPFTVEDAVTAAMLRPATRGAGLSLGDRACLALARRLEAPALTADTAWAELDIGVDVQLIR